MTDGRCATCKWWGKDDPAFGRYWPLDERFVLEDDVNGRRCCTLTLTFRGEDEFSTKASAYGRGPDALLYTDANFGCVQHEPREDDTA